MLGKYLAENSFLLITVDAPSKAYLCMKKTSSRPVINCFAGIKFCTCRIQNIKLFNNAKSTVSIGQLGKQIKVELPVEVITGPQFNILNSCLQKSLFAIMSKQLPQI
jgi:hypothetical protein